MSVEEFFEESPVQNDLCKEDDECSPNKWKSVSDEVAGTDNNLSSGFDCNICLDFVQDPVVTLCGHLYCWPCIYKWIHFQGISTEYPDQQQQAQCPVCNAEVSSATLVPLYGRGQTTKPSKGKAPQLGLVVPRRPSGPCWEMLSPTTTPSPRPTQQLHHRSYQHQPQPYYLHSGAQSASPPLQNLGVSTTASTFHPIIGMISEMVYARMFGNSVTNLYNSPNSYHLAGSSTPRARMYEMQADKSLSRICFFLFCCIFLCLVLF